LKHEDRPSRPQATTFFQLLKNPALTPCATPLITQLQVIPVAGRDSMLLNLSGAHGPFSPAIF